MVAKLFLALALVMAGMAAGLVLADRVLPTDLVALDSRGAAARPEPAPAPPPSAEQAPPRRTLTDMPDFSEVAGRTIDAVTNISALQVRREVNPFFNDPFFRRFFGDDEELFGRERRGTSIGSGVIVSPDGHVLTNNHVLGDSVREVSVVLTDKRTRAATIVGVDPLTDLALLKIEGQRFPTIPWGDSAQLRVAEWVLAIGNPYSLSQTVTLGIVSAVGRTNTNITAYDDFIQTDAAINPGNSGGALINRRGELIGINTAIFSQSGGYQGIGFAVPSNLARRVLDDLVKYGQVQRGSIGNLRTVSVTPELAQEYGLAANAGALVWEMSRASAAYQAGLRPGDVIDTFNGQQVTDNGQFVRLLADAPIGSVVTLGIQRNGRRFDVKVPVQSSTGAQPVRRRAA